MICREVAHALSVRTIMRAGQARQMVLLEQRSASLTVMPGLWELPALIESAVPEGELLLTARHAIMQVNYYVRIRPVAAADVKAMTLPGGERRWVSLAEAGGMALTGLARKVLARLHLISAAPRAAIAPREGDGVL
jgi:hypothetical protein